MACSSYLGYPRINFKGNFRADSNTHNNDVCNYRDASIPENHYVDWNSEGTNEFEFVNAKVTSVVWNDGTVHEKDDAIIGHSIIGNLDGPISKISDGSTRDPEVFTIYGMQFGIKWNEKTAFPKLTDIAFHGYVARCIATQFVWSRIPCYNSKNHGENPYQGSISAGVQFASTIKVNWPDSSDINSDRKSRVLEELQSKVPNGKLLSIRVTLFYTTRRYLPYLPYNGSLGYMVGSIGVHDTFLPDAQPDSEKIYDTYNIQGKRALFLKGSPKNLKFHKDDDICRKLSAEDIKEETWINFAPFEVIMKDKKSLVQLDLSNSIPTDLGNSLRDIGKLQLGILTQDCVELIGKEVNYDSEDQLYIRSGIHVVESSKNLDDAQLVLVQVINGDLGSNKICSNTLETAQILLQEEDYYVRPMAYYVDFLERDVEINSTQQIYVTRFGKPAPGLSVTATNLDSLPDSGPPKDGVIITELEVTTDDYGLAELTFERSTTVKISTRRQYYKPPDCVDSSSYTLPIDGQLYHFIYCAKEPNENNEYVCNKDIISFFLAFGDLDEVAEPNWVDHVHPILSQYANLSPMMKKILDLGNFTAVTLSKDLMKRTLEIRDLDNPSYMPTNRDLSVGRRDMILKWLDNPIFDSYETKPNIRDPKCPYSPDACDPKKYTRLDFSKVEDIELYCDKEVNFGKQSSSQIDILKISKAVELVLNQANNYIYQANKPTDPIEWDGIISSLNAVGISNDTWQILENLKDQVEVEELVKSVQCNQECTVDNLKAKLQEAVYLEWSTIPVYLTSLYSIIEGCNFEIYELIQSIVREEMSHFTQVANTLIAMGVPPEIDNDKVSTFMYEKQRLPGCVLPTLKPSLEKLSLEHVRKVFMVIEVPTSRTDPERHTIGWFYNQINKCIDELHNNGDLTDDDFQKGNGQVKWPKSDGTLVEVNSIESVKKGLKIIVEQGEGAGLIREEQVMDRTFPHFYKFEEIVCQKRLKKVNNAYSYTGSDIPFNENGVWPMRRNPTIKTIPVPSNCYTESRVFHKVYRMLLRKLQDLFRITDESKNNDIDTSIQLMESLQAHAKKLMWTKKSPDCTAACETCRECSKCAVACDKCDACEGCGPVWEYDWPEPEA